MQSKLHAVILAGGSGTRFWPLSRKSKPKQLLALLGDQPIINTTIERLSGLVPAARISIVCGPALADPTVEVTKAVGVDQLIVEPRARNTAPAILLAAAITARKDPNAVLAFLPSDHHVADPEAFRGVLQKAEAQALKGSIVTLGITPTRPETGFGYIQKAHAVLKDGWKVERFVEKPDQTTAQRYLESGDFFWNAGIFVTTVDTLLDEVQRQHPDTYEAFQNVIGATENELAKAIEIAFEQAPATSIDYAIMEKAQNIAVIPTDCGWSDVGHWAALHEVLVADQNNNIIKGNARVVRTANSVVLNTSDRLLTLCDMDGVVAVQTDDATLVLPRDRAQAVRDVVELLKENGLESYL